MGTPDQPTGSDGAKDPRLAAYLVAKLGEQLDHRGSPALPDGLVQRVVRRALPFIGRRALGEHRVKVEPLEGDGGGRTAIELLLPDQPFLVDTLRLNLRRLGLRERLVLHTIVSLDREEDGTIARLGDSQAREREAYLYAEIPEVAAEDRRRAIAAELWRVFDDVRSVFRDHGRMVRMIRKHTADIEFAGQVLRPGAASPSELMDFLAWIADDNYVFFGYRGYSVSRRDGEWCVCAQDEGLGLMREARGSRFREPQLGEQIPELVRARLEDDRLVFFDKSRTTAEIHREGRLDCISVKCVDETGNVVGFGRFIGLLTHKAISTRGSDIPLLRTRRDHLLRSIGAEEGSHDYKAAIEAFDSLPPEFLFPFDVSDIERVVQSVLRATDRGGVEIAVVPDPLNRSFFVSAMLPRAAYDEELRQDLQRLLVEKYKANYVEGRCSFVDDEVALLHFFCTQQHDVDLEALSELERDVQNRASSWDDRFENLLVEQHPEREAYRLVAEYAPLFSRDYRAQTHAADACQDLVHLERLRHGQSRVAVARFAGRDGPGASRVRVYTRERPYLTDLLPVLDNCGLRVLDAQQYEIPSLCEQSMWIVNCRLEGDGGEESACPPRVIEAVRAVLSDTVENGALNRLVLGAGLDWAEVDLIRAYLAYAAQLGIAPQIRAAAATLLRHPEATRALVLLFRVRFEPDLEGDRAVAEATLLDQVARAREPIRRADEDRVIGLLVDLVRATERTNFFTEGRCADHVIVLKLDPRRLARAPSPRPHAEIFVHSAEMSGVHLRGGPVARGGLRWSDRVQDFRKEILGLMKTQMVKNGLIVPVGAKGGFVLKRRPGDREEADRQYARFVRSLLAVTDNRSDAGVVAPERVVVHDGDDPYLVVAPDRGTAHLSDTANRIARECGYWLSDAFASGGSEGYDHKAAGITARGVWVCVRRHFLELGIDVELDTFTVAGIGDMAGDVFGNGLLLARRARLLAAFNHRHVFIDPDPDPDRAWEERSRLFSCPTSSWTDYDTEAISRGGGVFERDAKAIALSPEARAVLGVAGTAISGEELVRAVLRMPVDLLFNGGIGTYVKSSRETHAQVGDRSNDSVRVDGADLRARVVGEGGNLGLTQLARVEFALRGGALYTDAVDNSGGVDLSDHEVNFKVLLAARCESGAMSREERNRVLSDCADEVREDVLANSASQSRCISLDFQRASSDSSRMSLAAEFLAHEGGLDPELEFLPDREQLRARIKASGRGFTRPELAVLLGYTKLLAKRELIASEVPDQESFALAFTGYFPESLRERFGEEIARHPLRREITATVLTNRVIDQAGVTLIPELCSALGVGVAEVVACYHTVDRLLEADHLRFLIQSQEAAEEARLDASLRLERAVRAAARSRLGLERRAWLEPEEWAHWTGVVRSLREVLEASTTPEEQAQIERRVRTLVDRGIDAPLAVEIERLPFAVRALGVISVAMRSDVPLPRVVEVHRRLGEATRITWLLERLADLDRRDSWDRVAAESLHLEMLEVQRELTGRLLESDSAAAAVAGFLSEQARALHQIEETAGRVEGGANQSLAALAVLAQHIRRLL